MNLLRLFQSNFLRKFNQGYIHTYTHAVRCLLNLNCELYTYRVQGNKELLQGKYKFISILKSKKAKTRLIIKKDVRVRDNGVLNQR